MIPEIKALIKARKNLKMSRPMLGLFLGVSEPTVYRWEKGTCSPSPMARKRIKVFLMVAEELSKKREGPHE